MMQYPLFNGKSLPKPFHCAQAILLAALAFFILSTVNAQLWSERTVSESSPEEGAVCDVAIDKAGQTHVVFSSAVDGNHRVIYRKRKNSATPFETSVVISNSTSEIKHLAIAVDDSYKAHVAYVRANSELSYFRQNEASESFRNVFTVDRAADAGNTGGVSLVLSSSESHTSLDFDIIVFTGNDGRLRYILREVNANAWSAITPLSAAGQTGQAPKIVKLKKTGLIHSPSSPEAAVAFYNADADAVQVTYFDHHSATWSTSPETVASSVSDFSRVGIASAVGKLGICYRSNSGRSVNLAERNPHSASSTWSSQVVATSSELTSSSQLYDQKLGLVYDAADQPSVIYSRITFALILATTEDIRVRRFFPNLGWELSTIKNSLNSGYTNGLAVAASEAGDPLCVFEEDPGTGNSLLRISLPLSDLWVHDRSRTLLMTRPTFAPALTTDANGKTYYATSEADLVISGGGSIPTGSYNFRPPRIIIDDRTFSLPGENKPHVANALTVTPDGILHLVTLMLEDINDERGKLKHYEINPVSGSINGPFAILGGFEVVKNKSLKLQSDKTGQLYLSFIYGPSITTALTTKLPGNPNWTLILSQSQNVNDHGLTVRDDGAWCLAYAFKFDETLKRLVIRTNINLNTSVKTASSQTFFFDLPSGNTLPYVRTALMLDGRPLVMLTETQQTNTSDAASSFKVYYPVTGPSEAFLPLTLFTGNLRNGRFDVATDGDTVHAVVHHNLSGQYGLTHLRFNSQSLRTADSSTTINTEALRLRRQLFSTPPQGLSGYSNEVALSLDKYKFPLAAVGLGSFGLLSFIPDDDVLLIRPADATDPDLDDIPLLWEQAFRLKQNSHPTLPDNDQLHLPKPYTRIFTNEAGRNYELGVEHRRPDVARAPASIDPLHPPPSSIHGQYQYSTLRSHDLRHFFRADETGSVQAISGPSPVTPPQTGVVSDLRSIQCLDNHLATFRQTFVRLGVDRIR